MQLDLEVLVYIMAGFVAAQAVGVSIFFIWLAHRLRSQEAGIERACRTAGEKLQQLEHNLDRLQVVRERLPEMATTASDQLSALSVRIDELDREVERGVRFARDWLARGDRRVEAGLLQFQRHTSRMQKLIRHPAVRASAITKAGLAFLTQLLAADRKPPSQRSSPDPGDAEIFI